MATQHESTSRSDHAVFGPPEPTSLRRPPMDVAWLMVTRQSELFSRVRACVEPLGFSNEHPKENVFVRYLPGGLLNRITVPIDVPHNRNGFTCTVNLMVAQNILGDHPETPPRLSVNIGSVLPRRMWRYWEIPLVGMADDVWRQITSSLKVYAVPWFDRFADVDDLTKASKSERYIMRRSRQSSLPSDRQSTAPVRG